MTIAAQTAKAIRKELKAAFPNEKFRVRSETYSMGNAVSVYIGEYVKTGARDCRGWDVMEKNEVMKEVEKIISKYKYGSFNGMEDIYEYTNRRDDIPQVKFVSLYPLESA